MPDANVDQKRIKGLFMTLVLAVGAPGRHRPLRPDRRSYRKAKGGLSLAAPSSCSMSARTSFSTRIVSFSFPCLLRRWAGRNVVRPAPVGRCGVRGFESASELRATGSERNRKDDQAPE